MKFKRTPLLVSVVVVGVLVGFGVGGSMQTNLKGKDFVHFLFVQEGAQGDAEAAFLLTYYLPGSYLHLYRLNSSITVLYEGEPTLLFGRNRPGDLRHFVEGLLNIEVDGLLRIRAEGILRLLEQVGPIPTFNLSSEAFGLGEMVLNASNYRQYLDGIGDKFLRSDAATSLWLNGLFQHFAFLSQVEKRDFVLRKHHNLFETQHVRRAAFVRLLNDIIDNIQRLYFVGSSMNVEQASLGGGTLVVPLRNGNYDRRKFRNIMDSFVRGEPSLRRFPITVQVKNATQHKRLAAKTSGILRVRRCTVKEYLNSELPLERTVLLDRSGSPLKRSYMSQITKTSRFYFAFDYRNNFDFTLYIGEDYYAIPFLKSNAF